MKIGQVSGDTVVFAALGIAAAAGAWIIYRNFKQTGGIVETAAGAVGAVAEIAEDIAVGTVLGIGDVFGIPRTNAEQGAADAAAGRTWDASFSMPAGDFIKYVLRPSTEMPIYDWGGADR